MDIKKVGTGLFRSLRDNGKAVDILMITLYTVFGFIFIMGEPKKFMYLPFAFTMVLYLYYLIARKIDLVGYISVVLLYCVIMPDNFSIIFLSGAAIFFYVIWIIVNKKNNVAAFIKGGVFTQLKNKYKTDKLDFYIILFYAYLIINIIVTDTKLVNVFFFLAFNFSFFGYYYIYRNTPKNQSLRTETVRSIRNIIIIQFIVTILRIIFQYEVVINNLGSDWSIGTLGVSQVNILMLMCAFSMIRYFHEYTEKKCLKRLLLVIISLFVAISTACIANNLILFMAIIFYSLFFSGVGWANKLKYLGLTFVLAAVFLLVSPDWVRKDVRALTNVDYLVTRVSKIASYKDVFIEIPSKDTKFLVVGNGAGYYSSRAALTTGGRYIANYYRYFDLSLSEYTEKYVYEKLYAQRHGGVEETPYSSVISIMGEFGIIGMFLFIMIFFYLCRSLPRNKTLLVIFFVGMCFVDNWIEFPKVGLFLWANLYE